VASNLPDSSKTEPLALAPLVKANRSARARIAEYIAYKAQGLKNSEIAEKLGIKTASLNTLVSKASKNGWLVLDDPEERLEYEIKPIVVDNVKEFLTTKDNDAAKLKMTVETAKGIGLFKAHQAVKVEGAAAQMVLALKFETPTANTSVVEGHIIGAPKIPEKTDET
jgi:transposase